MRSRRSPLTQVWGAGPKEGYDPGMTRFAKIAISLPAAQLERARAAVRAGRAGSVSAYVTDALERQHCDEDLEGLVAELKAAHGEPSAEDRAWAQAALRGG